ncbi:TRAP transporter small permease subunit [Comamonas sp. NoAH]|uniref:TRAP transporter small permease subunit n=1 Tax=Comamonas halotolerans TaxID=3041496 RepID=UPI0024E185AB|nr:TRAP transporter small permease [Comamonas sp. NoAH]
MHSEPTQTWAPLRWACVLSQYAVWVAGALLIASVLLICFDVLARKFFGFNTGGADELSSFAFAISTSWALAFATLQRANVRVDVLYQKLPLKLAAFLDWLSVVALGVFIVFLTWYAWDVLAASWIQNSTANSTMATPLWIPQGMWFIGLMWMSLVMALMLCRSSYLLVTGDIDALQKLCGVRSAQEEADEEAANGKRLIQSEREGR